MIKLGKQFGASFKRCDKEFLFAYEIRSKERKGVETD